MKRYHEERARIRSEHRIHLRRVHHWPKEPVDCECELQAGRFRKKKALDCGKPACLVCHYEKILGIASYQDRLRLLQAKDSMADYFEEVNDRKGTSGLGRFWAPTKSSTRRLMHAKRILE